MGISFNTSEHLLLKDRLRRLGFSTRWNFGLRIFSILGVVFMWNEEEIVSWRHKSFSKAKETARGISFATNDKAVIYVCKKGRDIAFKRNNLIESHWTSQKHILPTAKFNLKNMKYVVTKYIANVVNKWLKKSINKHNYNSPPELYI